MGKKNFKIIGTLWLFLAAFPLSSVATPGSSCTSFYSKLPVNQSHFYSKVLEAEQQLSQIEAEKPPFDIRDARLKAGEIADAMEHLYAIASGITLNLKEGGVQNARKTSSWTLSALFIVSDLMNVFESSNTRLISDALLSQLKSITKTLQAATRELSNEAYYEIFGSETGGKLAGEAITQLKKVLPNLSEQTVKHSDFIRKKIAESMERSEFYSRQKADVESNLDIAVANYRRLQNSPGRLADFENLFFKDPKNAKSEPLDKPLREVVLGSEIKHPDATLVPIEDALGLYIRKESWIDITYIGTYYGQIISIQKRPDSVVYRYLTSDEKNFFWNGRIQRFNFYKSFGSTCRRFQSF